MRLEHVVGTRPQFVKLAPILAALAEHASVRSSVLHSGQHYDPEMSRLFFDQFGVGIDADLGIRAATHGAQTGRMIEAMEARWLAEPPDAVVAYGDTNTTLAAALAAVKLDVPVLHVEAGLRAAALGANMPEEINRAVVDRVSRLLFVPTASSAENLRREGFSDERVLFTGDVMYDIVLQEARRADLPFAVPERFALATWHRAENTDDPDRLAAIAEAFAGFSDREMPVILPLHPRTRQALAAAGRLDALAAAVTLTDPVGYRQMVALMQAAALVISDSGGVPKEAAFLGKPSVILRRDPVWIELVEQGWSQMVVPETADRIIEGLSAAAARPLPARPLTGFGDGDAAVKIAGHLARFGGAPR